MPSRRCYKVIFHNQGKVYEVFARSVAQGELFGFVAIEELLFGERSEIVVDPTEEGLKTEFKGVKRSYIPMHAVIRIDEVEKQGISRVAGDSKGEVAPFPAELLRGPGREKK